MARKPTVAIVGCGRAGGAIGLALKASGYPVVAAWSRSRAGRQRAHRLLDVPVMSALHEIAAAGDITLVAVPDDAIADVASDLAPHVRKGRYVLHTAGGVSVDALGAVRSQGARVGCVHPLQTLPSARRGAEALRGAAVAVTCDAADRAALFRLARGWGGRPFPLPDASKTLYHAAAVFASNYLVTAIWAATTLMRAAGVADGERLLSPLAAATVANVAERGPHDAITGPVARGDARAVRRHLEALRDARAPRTADAYRSLARLTAELVGADAAVEEAIA